jgi:hypothetical protein
MGSSIDFVTRGLRSLSRQGTTIAVTAAITFMLTSVTGVAFAAATGTINACVSNNNGKITIVSATATCSAGDTLLTWNQQGIQGPAGPQGPQGATGATGSTGAAGPNPLSGIGRPGTPELPQGTFSYFADGSVYSAPADCSTGRLCMVRVYCPVGMIAIGGRYFLTDNLTGSAYANISSAGTFHYGSETLVTPFRQLGDGFIIEYTTMNVPPAQVPTSYTVTAQCAAGN